MKLGIPRSFSIRSYMLYILYIHYFIYVVKIFIDDTKVSGEKTTSYSMTLTRGGYPSTKIHAIIASWYDNVGHPVCML